MTFRNIDPQGDELAELNRNLVPIKLAKPLATVSQEQPEPQLVSVVQLDIAQRPDVADLMRVMRIEGFGPQGQGLSQTFYTASPHPGVLYKFDIDDPAPCKFNVFLRWPQHQQALELMAERGYFYLLTSDPSDPDIRGGVVAINGPELATMIELWQTADD